MFTIIHRLIFDRIQYLLIVIQKIPKLFVHYGSIWTFYYLSVSELGFIVDNEVRYNVTSLVFVANGNSDFMSAIFENFRFEEC